MKLRHYTTLLRIRFWLFDLWTELVSELRDPEEQAKIHRELRELRDGWRDFFLGK